MTPETPSDKDIFDFARKLDSSAVGEYLKQVCGDDPLREERIRKLMEADRGDSFLENPPVSVPDTIGGPAPVEGEGQVIGDYKLLQKIGEGGFGIVYMAEQTSPVRRQVALKIIKPGMDSKEVIARFEAERQALAMMDHPNIAKVFDGGETESGYPYFVMELVKGVPITRFCDENKLDTQDRLRLFRNVCNAIQHAHQKGVIHRDIKPSNVLVTLHDGKPVPKVIDFGVAKAVSQQLTAKTLFTRYGQMVGTPQYMSPEQAEMSGLDIDTRSDIYSLGVLLYELLTGTTPIDPARLRSTGYVEMQKMIRDEEPQRPSVRLSTHGKELAVIAEHRSVEPSRLQQTIRGELDLIVMKSLEKDRGRRYATPVEFSSDIDRYLNGDAVHACPPSTWYRIRKFTTRNRGLVGAAGSILFALMLGMIGTGTAWWKAVKSLESEKNAVESAKAATYHALKAERSAVGALEREKERKRELQQQQYISDMNAASLSLVEGDFVRIRSLLSRYSEESELSGLRRFEWHYLDNLCRELDQVPKIQFPNPAKAARFSGDGTRLIVAQITGQVSVFDMTHESPFADGEPTPIASYMIRDSVNWSGFVAPHPTLPIVAVQGKYNDLVLWNYESNESVVCRGHKATVTDVEFSTDGTWFASGDDRGDILLWDTEDTSAPARLERQHRSIVDLAISPSGDLLASAGGKVGSLVIWDMETKSKRSEFDFYNGCHCVEFSAGDEKLAAGTGHGSIHLFDVSSEDRLIGSAIAHDRFIYSMQFLSDGETLLTGSSDNTIRFWNTSTFSLIKTLSGHSGYVFTLDVTPDERQLVSASKDFSVRLWDLRPSNRDTTFLFGGPEQTQMWISELKYDPANDNQIVAALGKRGVVNELVNFNTSLYERSKIPVTPTPRCMDISNRGVIATITNEGEFQAWDNEDGRLLFSRPGYGDRGRVDFSVDGERVVVTRAQRNIEVWEIGGQRPIWEVTDQEGETEDVAFSPNGRYVASAGMDGTIRIRHSESGTLVNRLENGHKARVEELEFSPDGRYLASGGLDHSVVIWEDWLDSNPKSIVLRGHTATVRALQFLPDGETLCSAGSDRTIKFWDLPSEQVRFTFFTANTIECLGLSSDGSELASGGRGCAIRIWRAPRGEHDGDSQSP